MSQVKVTADSGGGTVSLKAPASTTSNAAVVLTLPVDDGAANTFLKSNGSGVTSFAAPTATEIGTTSGTASASTFLCGNNTWAEAGGGKILQVISNPKTDVWSSTATGWLDVTGTDQNGSGSVWCIKITPSATSSKILIDAITAIHQGVNDVGSAKLVRGSTDLGVADAYNSNLRAGMGFYDYPTSNYGLYGNGTIRFLDSPNTTSEVTYQLKIYTYSSDTTYINRGITLNNEHTSPVTASYFTAMEVSA